jgi:hypothetical protein
MDLMNCNLPIAVHDASFGAFTAMTFQVETTSP